MKKNLLTNRQYSAAMDFIATAESNNMQHIRAAFRSTHPLVRWRTIRTIRAVKDAIAESYDELGNRTILTPDLRVLQIIKGN